MAPRWTAGPKPAWTAILFHYSKPKAIRWKCNRPWVALNPLWWQTKGYLAPPIPVIQVAKPSVTNRWLAYKWYVIKAWKQWIGDKAKRPIWLRTFKLSRGYRLSLQGSGKLTKQSGYFQRMLNLTLTDHLVMWMPCRNEHGIPRSNLQEWLFKSYSLGLTQYSVVHRRNLGCKNQCWSNIFYQISYWYLVEL